MRRGGNRRRNPARAEGTETSLSIMNFRNQIQDLARPNLFQVAIEFPTSMMATLVVPMAAEIAVEVVVVVAVETVTKKPTCPPSWLKQQTCLLLLSV